MVADVGLTIRPVPGRILIPLLQSASLEEDDDLQKRWAALLANAATEGRGSTILPASVEVLRQLTPAHVLILDWIYENARQPSNIEPSIDVWRDVQWDEVSYRFGIDRPMYTLLASDLHRLQVIDGAL